jgi:hypothetical protein
MARLVTSKSMARAPTRCITQVYYEELFEWCAYSDARQGRLSEDDVRGQF